MLGEFEESPRGKWASQLRLTQRPGRLVNNRLLRVDGGQAPVEVRAAVQHLRTAYSSPQVGRSAWCNTECVSSRGQHACADITIFFQPNQARRHRSSLFPSGAEGLACAA